jgi:hypothetical protein
MVHFFKFGIQEGRFSMDDIHFMRKTADIKKVSPLHPPKLIQRLNKKKLAYFYIYFTQNLPQQLQITLEKFLYKIDIYISTTERCSRRANQDL